MKVVIFSKSCADDEVGGSRIEEHVPYDADFCGFLGEVNVWNEVSH
jgi:hypothetical protein